MKSKEETKGVIEAILDPERVLPHSKVNFDRLTDQEMTKRLVNRFEELQQLRTSFEKAVKNEKSGVKSKLAKQSDPSVSLVERARERVKAAQF